MGSDYVRGGADSTTSTLSSFIFAMSMFPEVQHKAQEVVDLTIGADRLPGIED
jgi:hypothetical protein